MGTTAVDGMRLRRGKGGDALIFPDDPTFRERLEQLESRHDSLLTAIQAALVFVLFGLLTFYALLRVG